ncbi:hypothetical protein CEXT_110831 [Caerostris extrusa]|uniref:Uncharacterized protein n=1 Tax=Caerostris extrusa TaxID=172846 RepID=A0AAV4Q635_CAEEX|nr:hypothetical protein CEXT_110831 [Caerostris extrusa]
MGDGLRFALEWEEFSLPANWWNGTATCTSKNGVSLSRYLLESCHDLLVNYWGWVISNTKKSVNDTVKNALSLAASENLMRDDAINLLESLGTLDILEMKEGGK